MHLLNMVKVQSPKFLIDESVEYRIVKFLRESSFDILAITEKFPSTPDVDVLSIAYKEKRVLITNDKDFGELVFKDKKGSHGVILIRMPFNTTEEKIIKLDQVLKAKAIRIIKAFTVVTESKVRIRKS